MRETLRLCPSAPTRSVLPIEDEIIGGKYAVEKGSSIIVNTYTIHHDPEVWGEDVRDHCHTVFQC